LADSIAACRPPGSAQRQEYPVAIVCLDGRGVYMQNRRLISWMVALVLAAAAPLVVARAAQTSDDQAMVAAARAVLEALDPGSSESARFGLLDDERRNWHYVPRARKGVALGALTPGQRAAVDRLLGTTLSPSGVAKVSGIIELERILGRLEGNPSFRDGGRYHVSLFGDPDPVRPWGWRLEGDGTDADVPGRQPGRGAGR
jgi:hypothetical protein